MSGENPSLALYEQSAQSDSCRWEQEANAIDIRDGDDAQAVASWLVEDLGPRRKAVEQFFAPLVEAAHKAHKALTTKRASILALFERPETIAKAKLAAWEQERRAAEQRDPTPIAEGAVVTMADLPDDRLTGVAFVKTWSAEVVDLKALCRAIADGKAPENLVAADMKVLGQLARALKSAFNVPGCRAVSSLGARRTAA
jgi:hypothetical protein